MTIDQILYAIAVPTISVLVYWLRQRATSQSYTEKTDADNSAVQEKSRAETSNALVEIAKQGVVAQLRMIDVVQENTRAAERNEAMGRGLILALDGHGKAITEAMTRYDASFPIIQTSLAAIQQEQTELGETINDQFGPVVDALKDVGGQLKNLVTEIQVNDGRTNSRLNELVNAFKSAEQRLVARLDHFVGQRTTAELVALDSPLQSINGKDSDK